jgi:hypothetical protein
LQLLNSRSPPTSERLVLISIAVGSLFGRRPYAAAVALAAERTAWAQTQHPARRWEPKGLRLRLFSIAARLARSSRRTALHLSNLAPWAALLLRAFATLRALPAPG